MEKLISFEAAINAAKIAFCWNSSDGSLVDFQKDMINILCDYSEDQIMNMGRRISNAADNCSGINFNARRAANGLPQVI
ncbi:MAG: hypothetical protein GXX10_11275 [Clostridiaceae bacterium]|nr:hypothetical protein [Clostridiaceae bacterium]